MNKKDLREKWSKYCDTDKLVIDTRELLDANGHRNTEHGVCVLLDTYFTNKEPLIKLLSTSKNYVGDMRIIMEKGFDRKISSPAVRTCINRMMNDLNVIQMTTKTNKDGKGIFDYLLTGQKSFDITELPGATQQAEKIKNMKTFNYQTLATASSQKTYDEFMRYMDFFSRYSSSIIEGQSSDPMLIKGTKTSRAFNKVCLHYGVNKFNAYSATVEEGGKTIEKTTYPYNKLFAEYSDLVSALQKKIQFIISLNPLDYLTMSNGVNWHSCHNIKSGSCKGGCLSYMLDETSIVTFVVEGINRDIHEIPKVYRQMYHYKDCFFVQNRLYPQGNDGATNLYNKFKGFMIDEFSELLHIKGEWGADHVCNAYIKNKGTHYRDYNYNRNCNVFYPHNKTPIPHEDTMVIGHDGICVNCGKTFTDAYYLAHPNNRNCSL